MSPKRQMVRDDKPWQPTPEQAAEIERWDKQVAAHRIENERLIGVVQDLERSLESERAARARLHHGLTQAVQLAASGALVKDHDPPTRTTHVWEETIESWGQALADRSPLEWLAARDEKIRAECSAIATFYVPGETQSTEADAAPNLRCAWEWGAAHAASRIGAVLGGASADDTSARMQDGPTTAQTDDDALWPPPDRTTPGARNSPEAYMAAHPPDTTLDAAIDEIHELRTKVAHLEEVLRRAVPWMVTTSAPPRGAPPYSGVPGAGRTGQGQDRPHRRARRALPRPTYSKLGAAFPWDPQGARQMSPPRVSDEDLAALVREIEAEDERARNNREAHGNYGEDFGAVLFDLSDARTRIRELEALLSAQARVIEAARAWREKHPPEMQVGFKWSGTTKDLIDAVDALPLAGTPEKK